MLLVEKPTELCVRLFVSRSTVVVSWDGVCTGMGLGFSEVDTRADHGWSFLARFMIRRVGHLHEKGSGAVVQLPDARLKYSWMDDDQTEQLF